MLKDYSLYKKYNIPGPRYTSYPTVPYWESTPTQDQWLENLSQSFDNARNENTGMSLYLHIPFCESLCTYCGCNTRITKKKSVSHPYVNTLLKELKNYHDKIPAKDFPNLAELHLGGGTPTFLAPEELKILLSEIFNKLPRHTHFEYSIEVDPRVTTTEHLKVLNELNFKRISLGVQDFDPHVQKTVNRINSKEMVFKLTQQARELDFTSINYDLIYGLPFQTSDSVKKTIENVVQLRPDRIAFYAYAHVPWIKPSQRRFTEADLPSGDEKRVLYETGRTLLESAGYKEIGMDHFALETDSLWKATIEKKLHRNFMGYTSQYVSPQLGLGVSSISDSWNIFMQNEKHLEQYRRRVEEGDIPILRGHILTAEDKFIRKNILNLMTQFETKIINGPYFELIQSNLESKIKEFISDHLITYNDGKLTVLEDGKPFLRNICMAFDARLIRKQPETELFSRTI